MIKKLMSYIGKYKTPSILTPIFILFEVGIEVSIPFVISKLIDQGIQNEDITYVIEMRSALSAMFCFKASKSVMFPISGVLPSHC